VKKPRYVLNSYALLAYFQAEAAGLEVKGLLVRAWQGKALAFLSLINLGEIVYITARKLGREVSMEVLQDVLRLPIRIVEATMDRVVSAAQIQAAYPISYADAFAVGLAQEMNAAVVTRDPALKQVEPLVTIMWL
jgi:predicted nucleic acid-binding protein